MKVFKFGGGCIQSPEAIRTIKEIIQAEQDHILVVVSAMGQTTRRLEEVVLRKTTAQPYEATIRRLYQFHQAIVDRLLNKLKAAAQQALIRWEQTLLASLAASDIERSFSLEALYSNVVAEGELLASRLIYYYLRETDVSCAWLDARRCIKTHGGYCNAQISWQATRHLVKACITPQLQQQQIVLTQGFIGSDQAGTTTTLGKEGSDFTGAILATVLGAQSLTVWKDVPGIMHADPRLCKQAIKFDRISYKTVADMAFYGAKVIHPSTIQPIAAYNIPLYVRPFHQPREPGTVVTDDINPVAYPIFILKTEQRLIELSINDLTFLDEAHVVEVFQQLTHQSMRANMVEKSARTLSICLDSDGHRLDALMKTLTQRFNVIHHPQVSLLTVIHEANALPEDALPQQDAILLIQRSKNRCQVVFQEATILG